MVKAILIKSEANEEKEAQKEALKRDAQKASGAQTDPASVETTEDAMMQDSEHESDEEEDEEDDDIDMLDEKSENADATTEGSIIKIDRKKQEHENLPDDANDDEPDVYDVNVLAWDAPVSALHLAIANGHTDVVKVLVQDFGADVLLPIKLVNDYNKTPRAAILPLVLALQLSPEKATEMTKVLMGLGASPVSNVLSVSCPWSFPAELSVRCCVFDSPGKCFRIPFCIFIANLPPLLGAR